MQLQGGACAYNLSASCKNSSARSQAKGVPQAVGSYLFALPAVPYSLFLPSEKFTMASRMYVVKRGKPHLKHCVPEAVFLAGLAAMRQQAMFSCYLCVLFSRYRWAERDGHVRQNHLQDQQTLLWTKPGFRRPSTFSF